jgi:hypothetical protein
MATSSMKQKGKKRMPQEMPPFSASSSAVRGTIVVEESDEEEDLPVLVKRSDKKRWRDTIAVGVDSVLDDDGVEEVAIMSGSKKKLIGASEGASGTSGKNVKRQRLSQPMGEVIVIDD